MVQQILPIRRNPNLLLHCGAQAVQLEEVSRVTTPEPTPTWRPIPHHLLLQQVRGALDAAHLTVGAEAHSLSHGGQRYFGLMEVNAPEPKDDYALVIGLRNSHDQTFPAGIVAGAQVFVCDNLSFSGEVKFARKHTRNIGRDLPQIVVRAISRLVELWHDQDRRIAAYKGAELEDTLVHDLLIRAIDVGVCSNRFIPAILHLWRNPPHEEFQARSMWSLFNSFTEALKKGNLHELPKRTESLHGLLDARVGLTAVG